jgi:hypothetical protein
MKLKLNDEQIKNLRAFLEKFEDAEKLTEKEFVVDLYDLDKPVSMDLVFIKSGVAVDGAAYLEYDEEMDGWYMGERIEEPEPIAAALEQAGAFEA